MGKLYDQLKEILPKKLWIPDELAMLYDWIEQRGTFIDNESGFRSGFLYPVDELESVDDEREGGTIVLFTGARNQGIEQWFGRSERDPEIVDRLCVFARTGGDGSEAALWLDDSGELKIVHMGSGSGSLLSCVLADNMVDFLRLIAIGYDEICWDECFAWPPNDERADSYEYIHPNLAFQLWVQDTFNTTIPETALEIIKHPSSMDDESSEDAFCQWLQKIRL
ncbi:hypothetical protein SOASR030_36220 [Leminorella grimontii]|uniref:SMI1/KNR4 family protein n=1 Tax=Leminorella grimontii TaxID=82981 RepID=A0AAV5N5W0_9GAMM|nr:hypothetical protein [Leminorella grimontii]KFC98219.1 hypothetical protein GLGR_0111 [Leminorella grimontii ATCC 33999 = DSM 5078]GKX57510.1 hypothetical protein SOASR030_36220 [Leminorella grimontii]VFS56143.1 Uncharacterised protein [Leminorella grimontii]